MSRVEHLECGCTHTTTQGGQMLEQPCPRHLEAAYRDEMRGAAEYERDREAAAWDRPR